MELVAYKTADGGDAQRRMRVAAGSEVGEYEYFLALTAYCAELGGTFIEEALGPLAKVCADLIMCM